MLYRYLPLIGVTVRLTRPRLHLKRRGRAVTDGLPEVAGKVFSIQCSVFSLRLRGDVIGRRTSRVEGREPGTLNGAEEESTKVAAKWAMGHGAWRKAHSTTADGTAEWPKECNKLGLVRGWHGGSRAAQRGAKFRAGLNRQEAGARLFER